MTAIAWLLTYLLHSTLFLGIAALAAKPLARRSVRAEEALWRFALVAGLVTASLQLAAGWEPLGGRYEMALTATPSSAVAPSLPAERSAVRAVRPEVPEPAAGSAALAPVPASPTAAFTERIAEAPVSIPSAVLGLWALGAALLLGGCARSYFRLGRLLRARPRVVGGTLYSQLLRLAGEAGLTLPVELTCSSKLPVPVALGVRRPEICVPPRALAGLTEAQQEGMLAHELAHLVRRDPFWLALSHILASVLFFQPLNWVARRRLRETSELLSDEWAIARTGRPVSLARCLAEVAGWSAGRVQALPAPGMADRPSNLARRIGRLLDEARSPERSVKPVWLVAGMVILLVGVVAVAPAISARQDDRPDVAEAVEPTEPVEPAEPEEPAAPTEFEYDYDFEYDAEEISEDVAEAVSESVSEAVAEAMEAMGELDFEHEFEFPHEFEFEFDGDLEEAFEMAGFNAEEIAGIRWGMEAGMREAERAQALAEVEFSDEELERIAREAEESIRPEMERLEKEFESRWSDIEAKMPRAELERMAAEAERIAERARPSEAEMERLHAEVEKLRQKGALDATERERLHREARRLAEQARPSTEEMKALRELQEKHRETMRKFQEEHRAEMEALRRDMEVQSRALREKVHRQLEQDGRLRHKMHADGERQRQRSHEDREHMRREHEQRRQEIHREMERERQERHERMDQDRQRRQEEREKRERARGERDRNADADDEEEEDEDPPAL